MFCCYAYRHQHCTTKSPTYVHMYKYTHHIPMVQYTQINIHTYSVPLCSSIHTYCSYTHTISLLFSTVCPTLLSPLYTHTYCSYTHTPYPYCSVQCAPMVSMYCTCALQIGRHLHSWFAITAPVVGKMENVEVKGGDRSLTRLHFVPRSGEEETSYAWTCSTSLLTSQLVGSGDWRKRTETQHLNSCPALYCGVSAS